MEQIKELLDILKETPQMALWGIGMYFIFILVKAASWIGALTLLIKQFIKRYFDYHNRKLDQSSANRILKLFNNSKISGIPEERIIELLSTIRSDMGYIHESAITEAIKKIKGNK